MLLLVRDSPRRPQLAPINCAATVNNYVCTKRNRPDSIEPLPERGEAMPTINNSVNISAPIAKVFEYVVNPMNLPEWMVGIVEVNGVSGSGVGQHHHWTYKMVGIPLRGETTITEHVPNARWVADSKGGATSIFTFAFAPHEGGTKLDVDIEYTIPVPVLGKLAERLVLKRNQDDMDASMAKLKRNLERQTRSDVSSTEQQPHP